MTTLTDFLLARIAEDEAGASDRHLFDCVLDHIDGRNGCSCIVPARVLAECEAKCRIVEECFRALSGRDIDGAASDGDDGPWLADRTLRTLALPYADHPDYREEWKQ